MIIWQIQIMLRQHEKSHSWKRTYQCPKCPKIFGNSSNRDKHIRAIHEKIQPYKCTICDRSLSDPSNLKKHIRSHTKERAFCCREEGCDAAFAIGLELRQHLWNVHNIHSMEALKPDPEKLKLVIG